MATSDFIETTAGFVNLANVVLVKLGAGNEDDLVKLENGQFITCRIVGDRSRWVSTQSTAAAAAGRSTRGG